MQKTEEVKTSFERWFAFNKFAVKKKAKFYKKIFWGQYAAQGACMYVW